MSQELFTEAAIYTLPNGMELGISFESHEDETDIVLHMDGEALSTITIPTDIFNGLIIGHYQMLQENNNVITTDYGQPN